MIIQSKHVKKTPCKAKLPCLSSGRTLPCWGDMHIMQCNAAAAMHDTLKGSRVCWSAVVSWACFSSFLTVLSHSKTRILYGRRRRSVNASSRLASSEYLSQLEGHQPRDRPKYWSHWTFLFCLALAFSALVAFFGPFFYCFMRMTD